MNDYNLYKIKSNTLNTFSNLVKNTAENIYGLDFSKRYNIKKLENSYYYNPNIVTQEKYSSFSNWPPYTIGSSVYGISNRAFYIINNQQRDILLNKAPFAIPILASDAGSPPILFYNYSVASIDGNLMSNYFNIPENYSINYPIPIYGPNKYWTASYFFYRTIVGEIRSDDIIKNRLFSLYNFDENITDISYCFAGQRFMKFLYNFPNSPHITNMSHAYESCQNIRESAYCPPNVIDFNSAFYGCWNLTGTPVCSDKVVNMDSAYSGCRRITGAAAVGPSVITMRGAYSGSGVTTINIGPNVIDMSGAYSSCPNLISPIRFEGLDYHNVIYANSAFSNTNSFCGVPIDFPAKDCISMADDYGTGETIASGYYTVGRNVVNAHGICLAHRGISRHFFRIETPPTTDFCNDWSYGFAVYSNSSGYGYGNLYITNPTANIENMLMNRHWDRYNPVLFWNYKKLNVYACSDIFQKFYDYGPEWVYNAALAKNGQKWNTRTSSYLACDNMQLFIYKI